MTIRWLGDACKEDQGNKDKCAAFAMSVGAATGSIALGQFYRDQCLEYLCSTGSMPASSSQLPPPPPVYQMYPWGVVASETKVLQAELNKKLVADGLCPLGTDGKLGAATCGAAAKYGVSIPTCAGHSATPPAPCTGGAPPPKKEETPPVVGAGLAPSKGAPWGWIIGGVVVVGLVLASRQR